MQLSKLQEGALARFATRFGVFPFFLLTLGEGFFGVVVAAVNFTSSGTFSCSVIVSISRSLSIPSGWFAQTQKHLYHRHSLLACQHLHKFVLQVENLVHVQHESTHSDALYSLTLLEIPWVGWSMTLCKSIAMEVNLAPSSCSLEVFTVCPSIHNRYVCLYYISQKLIFGAPNLILA